MFKANDTVLYGVDGVCRVEGVETRPCGRERFEYYVLKPVNNVSATTYIPIDNPALTRRMRRVLSAGEILEIIRSMPQEEPLWIENDLERRRVYAEIMQSGDRAQLMRVVKTLYLRREKLSGRKRKMHAEDEKFLKDAERTLYEEFAYVLDIRPDQVLPFIARQICLIPSKGGECT